MEEKENRGPGQAGLGERLAKVVLQSPPLSELLVLAMKSVDPSSAPGLARAMLWEDPVVLMSAAGAFPSLAGWLAGFLLELGRQLDTLPPRLLNDFAANIIRATDGRGMAEIPPVYASVVRKAFADGEMDEGQAARLLARLVNGGIAGADALTLALCEERERAGRVLALASRELDTKTARRVAARLAGVAREARRAGAEGPSVSPAVKAAFAVAVVLVSVRVLARRRSATRRD